MKRTACVIGSGPNGLAAAIVLAQAGLQVEVYEAEAQLGGGARTAELTLPGFHNDVASAVHPLGIGSPFFSSLPLQNFGLQWIHSPAAVAHPMDDGSAVLLHRDLHIQERELGQDGKAWRNLMEPFAARWWEFAPEVLRPMPRLPRHPFLLARFGLRVLPPARTLANTVFRTERAKALWAGIAAHSFLSHDEWLSTAFGMVLSIAAHAVGWPIPRGGAQSLSDALCAQLSALGGSVKASSRVSNLADLPESGLFMFDVTPRQLVNIAGERFTPTFRRLLQNFEYGPGVFKVDYALSSPIPWKAQDCATAATVHVGGTLDEIAASEQAMSDGRHAEHPFVILTQPSLFDSTRAPEGKHTAWAYCHVPNGSNFDMLGRIEDQIERFAPGFRECVLGRKVFSPAALESVDSNIIGGDISGGRLTVRQLLFRPTWRHYGTSARDIYICSSSTPPGGGVHGMCGYHAAKMALSKLPKN